VYSCFFFNFFIIIIEKNIYFLFQFNSLVSHNVIAVMEKENGIEKQIVEAKEIIVIEKKEVENNIDEMQITVIN
jgi:hypothetical protein